MVGDGTLLLLGEHLGALLKTTHNTVDGIKEILTLNLFLILAGGTEGCLVAHIGNVSAAEARGLLGQKVTVNMSLAIGVVVEFKILHVDGKDSFAFLNVG